MKNDAAPHFGEYLRRLRKERGLSIRELARRSHLDSGGLTRLEQGTWAPKLDTLKALATALDVPLADLLAIAGYFTPSDLPSMNTYLRVRYGDLSEHTLASIENYIRHLIDNHGLDPTGPDPREDETGNQSKK